MLLRVRLREPRATAKRVTRAAHAGLSKEPGNTLRRHRKTDTSPAFSFALAQKVCLTSIPMAANRNPLAIATGRYDAPVAGLRASFLSVASFAALSLYLPIGCRA